jgi:O-antigen/teichoic acid export membrane protein
VLLFALLFPLQVSLLGWHHFLVGKKLFKVLTKLLIFFYCFQILLQGLGVFAFKNQAVLMLVFSIILAFILNAICSFFAKKYVHNTKTSSETLTKGFTLTYSAVISSLIISGVHLAIGVFAGLESLALFYFGLKIAKLFHQVIKEIMKNVILPKASSFSIKELFSKQKLLTVTFAASVVVTAFLYIIFPYVLPPVLGENYLLSINYIQIIILSVPFWSISGLLLPFIYTNGKKSQIYIVENGPHIVSILALILFMLYKNVLILVYAELALGITFSIFASTIIYKIYKQQLTS